VGTRERQTIKDRLELAFIAPLPSIYREFLPLGLPLRCPGGSLL
jgi:hypothetical protein